MADPGRDWAGWMQTAFADLPPQLAVRGADPAIARDLAEERAAIMEYDGGLPRWQAEKLACAAHGLSEIGPRGRDPPP